MHYSASFPRVALPDLVTTSTQTDLHIVLHSSPQLDAVGDFHGATIRPVWTGPNAGRTPELQRLVGKAVETALDYLWQGGVLVPTVLAVPARDGRDNLDGPEHDLRLFGDPMSIQTDLAIGLQRARRFVDLLTPRSHDRYVWVYDGYTGDQRAEAVIIEAAERGANHAWRLAVRYRLSKRGISMIDQEAAVLGLIETPFTGVVDSPAE
jgi:hypothetical protein